MRFATYLPYDWKETKRDFVDYCSDAIGKEAVFCISADTLEDFVLGSVCIKPVCPEQLIVFEVKRFYWIDKIQHYLALAGAATPIVIDSNEIVNRLSKEKNISYPYQEFINFYRNMLNKTTLEFLTPKNKIIPLKIIDIKKVTEEAFANENVCLDEPKRNFLNIHLEDYQKASENTTDITYARCVRNLEAQFYFQNFVLNNTLMNVANEICGTNATYGNMDFDIYWTLHNKFDKKPCEQRLRKLINYVRQFICYE